MKLVPSLVAALASAAVLICPSALAFGPFAASYDGLAQVRTGKKSGSMFATGSASFTASDGSAIAVVITGNGARGTKADVTLLLASDGTASLTLVAKVLADPKQLKKRGDKPGQRGKKVVVRTRAAGTYTVAADGTVNLVLSGNSGKGGGTNVTGTFATTLESSLSLSLSSGFKQKLDGVGRRMSFQFFGTGAPVDPAG